MYVTDSYHNIIVKVMDICEPNHSDSSETFELKMKIIRFIKNEYDKLYGTEKYKHLKRDHNDLWSPDQISKYLK